MLQKLEVLIADYFKLASLFPFKYIKKQFILIEVYLNYIHTYDGIASWQYMTLLLKQIDTPFKAELLFDTLRPTLIKLNKVNPKGFETISLEAFLKELERIETYYTQTK